MSRFSGKCDLYDWIAGLGGWYDKDGKPAKVGETNVYYSDEYQDFLAFKKMTGGKIYQNRKIEGKTYTIEILFDTLLDLIPYYPYIVTMGAKNGSDMTVFITSESYVDTMENECLKNGTSNKYYNRLKADLQNHYREVISRYYNEAGRRVSEIVFFSKGKGITNFPIDDRFEVRFITEKPHWTGPKIDNADKGEISMSEADYNYYLGDSVVISYVKKAEDKIYLG